MVFCMSSNLNCILFCDILYSIVFSYNTIWASTPIYRVDGACFLIRVAS
jgi:hypothetical protein